MRLSPRRSSDEDATPPRGPVAAYAAVLDGRHLWLAVEGPGAGTLSLRDTESGDLIALSDDGAGDRTEDPAYTAVRADLTALPPPARPDEVATYDIVLKGTRLLPARPLWSPPLDESTPTRTPPGPDPTTQLQLERTAEGHLRLVRRRLPPAAELAAIDRRGAHVHLRIRPAGEVEPGCHLLMLDADDELLGSLPVTAHDGLVEALVGVDDLPAGYFGMIRFAVGAEGSWVRIRRRGSDLRDPNHAVLLPELFDPEGGTPDRPRARFRWSPDALLVARSLDPDELPS